MHDLYFMESLESRDNLNKELPHFLFLKKVLIFLVIDNFLVEIAVIHKFHNDAQ
jgi:hypothetical protein